MKDIIIMRNRELHRVEILQKLIDKRLIEPEAAEQLGLSVSAASEACRFFQGESP